MGEYKDIEGQIARIESAYRALCEAQGKFTPDAHERGTAFHIIMGTSFDADAPKKGSFYARLGKWTEHRPTLAGALMAIELLIAQEIDSRIEELGRYTFLRSTLKLPDLSAVAEEAARREREHGDL